jgi:hypothetical protein
MKLKIMARAYAKPKIKFTVDHSEMRIKMPVDIEGSFRDRVVAFAAQVAVAVNKIEKRRTMRGTVGMDDSGVLEVCMYDRVTVVDVREEK